jgi:hypothetical protein
MAKIDIPRTTLTKGAKGQDVKRLHGYLTAFGYFPNDKLKKRFAHWTPLVSDPPATMDAFDDTTEAALRMFQRVHGLLESGALDQATLNLMKKPRCGCPDPMPKAKSGALALAGSFVAQGNSWTQHALTFHYDNFTADVTQADARTAIGGAFDRWATVSPLRFSEATSGALIQIGWYTGAHEDGSNFDGAGGVLAHGFYPPPNGGNIAGDVHFDDAETWTVNTPPTGTDLATVSLHEIGHALGLDHSSDTNAVMYAYYGGARRELTADDIAGIQSIYPFGKFTLQTGTALHETDGTFAFVLAPNRDLFAIKKSNTGSHSTEVHVLSAATNYQSFALQTGTALHETDDTFEFLLAPSRDLFAIKKSNTGSHSTEVHVLSAATNYQSFVLQTGTALHETDATFQFRLAVNGDLFAIKKSNTGTGTTEVHVLSAATNYQSFVLQTGTALHETDATFQFLLALDRDLFAIKKSSTGTHTTEVHVLSAASNYQQFNKQTGTVLHETDATWSFDVTLARELFGIKRSNTGTHSTEVHVVSPP